MQRYGDIPRPRQPPPPALQQPPTLSLSQPAAESLANFNPPWAQFQAGFPPGPPQGTQLAGFQPPEDPAAAAQRELPQKAPPPTREVAPNGQPATEICKNFLKHQTCRWGAGCRYLHLDASDPRAQEVLRHHRPKTPPAPDGIGKGQQGLGALSLNLAERNMKDKPG